MISENLSFQNEIFSLHEKLWEKEKNLKNAFIDKEKELLDINQRNLELEKKLRDQQSLVDKYSLDNMILANQFTDIKSKLAALQGNFETYVKGIEEPNSTNEMNSIIDSIEKLMEKHYISLLNSETSTQGKSVVVKVKDEAKKRIQTLDEKFIEYLKKITSALKST